MRDQERSRARLDRRTFLKAASATAGVATLGFPLPLRAQPATVKIGCVHPITGPLAEPGQACRLGAQMAVDAINAAGGIKSLGGAKLELILSDTSPTSGARRPSGSSTRARRC